MDRAQEPGLPYENKSQCDAEKTPRVSIPGGLAGHRRSQPLRHGLVRRSDVVILVLRATISVVTIPQIFVRTKGPVTTTGHEAGCSRS
jgi:hypothetical protein